jgi:hypothetical protein
MSRFDFNRRKMLLGLGAGAATLGLLPWLDARRARAAGAVIPKRLIVFYGAGSLSDVWRPVASAGNPAPTETAWELSKTHAALADFKDQLIYLDGIGMVSEELDHGASGNAHDQGAKHSLAAVDSAGTNLPGGPSIDQFVAQKINSPTPVTKFSSLLASITAWDNGCCPSDSSASGPGTLLPAIWDPRRFAKTVFADVMPDDGGAAKRAKNQQSIYNLVRGEFSSLAPRLPTEDRNKLDAHLSMLSDLQAQLGLGARGCQPPDLSSFDQKINQKCDFTCYDYQNPDVFARNWSLSAELNAKTMVLAMACDLTRVGYLSAGFAADGLIGYTGGMFGTTDSHDLTHKVNGAKPVLADPAAFEIIRKAVETETNAFAALLKLLKDTPESDGRTMLDHTVVLWCSQIGRGDHSLDDLPWVLAGSGGDYFKTGRYLQLPKNLKSGRGLPHNDLFVSIANAMDIPVNTFGNPSCCNGPLAGLKA